MVNFPFLDSDVPRVKPSGAYISQLIRFYRASSQESDFNNRNNILTAEPLQQGYRYNKLHKTVSKFYRLITVLIALKIPLQEGLAGLEFHDDLVYKFKKDRWQN